MLSMFYVLKEDDEKARCEVAFMKKRRRILKGLCLRGKEEDMRKELC